MTTVRLLRCNVCTATYAVAAILVFTIGCCVGWW